MCSTHTLTHLKEAFYDTRRVRMCFLWCVISVMLSIRKLIDQFCGVELNPQSKCEGVCVCVQHHQIFKVMGQSVPAKGVQVQFVDCKISTRAFLVNHPV